MRTSVMSRTAFLLAICFLGGCASTSRRDGDAPRYTADGRLTLPADYREWVFLSSSVDLSYSDNPVHQFDNVFAPRAAYRAFQASGAWPDKTVLILENRGAAGNDPLARSGQFQNGSVIGLEAHVKDVARFKGGWGFFGFAGGKPGEMFPYEATCYACHRAHAAADTTFVQFYPTLLPVAKRLETLSPRYLREVGRTAQR